MRLENAPFLQLLSLLVLDLLPSKASFSPSRQHHTYFQASGVFTKDLLLGTLGLVTIDVDISNPRKALNIERFEPGKTARTVKLSGRGKPHAK